MPRKKTFWSRVGDLLPLFVGSFLVGALFSLVGVALFAAGYVLRNREQAKPEADRAAWKERTGLALMFLGVVVGGRGGMYVLLSEIAEEWS